MVAIVQRLEPRFVVPMMRVRFPLATQGRIALILGYFLIMKKGTIDYMSIKSMSFKRLLIIALSFFIQTFCFIIFFRINPERRFDIYYILLLLPPIFLSLYILLYKKLWIELPAKIIFSLLSLYFIATHIWNGFYLPTVFLMLLAIAPLIYLYKNTIRMYLISLKIKPFFRFKQREEISRKVIFLIIINLLVTYFSYLFHYESIYVPDSVIFLGGVLTFIYLLLSPSILKSIVKGVLFLGAILLLCQSSSIIALTYYWDYNNEISLTELLTLLTIQLILPLFILWVLIFLKRPDNLSRPTQ